MRASARLGLYGTVLVAVFAAAFAVAGAVVPEETVQAWAAETDDHTGDHAAGQDVNAEQHAAGQETSATGLALESGGFRLTGVSAPTETRTEGELALTVQGADGQPVTDFELSHEKELHLIVVRTDGAGFEHVHPERDTDGQWTIPWEWEQAGSYRIYAEFVPAATGEDLTLSTTVQVGGDVTPAIVTEPVTTAQTDGYGVSLDGDLVAGAASTLTVSVTRDDEPVTTLEPYLGAYGHLVALRDGDLAYLHVHPHGAEPQPGATSGPEVSFEVTAPTVGRYLLYLDFQVDGQVHTAEFVLDTDTAGSGSSTPGNANSNQHQTDGDQTEHDEEGGGHDHGE